jgi:hypothetical protein
MVDELAIDDLDIEGLLLPGEDEPSDEPVGLAGVDYTGKPSIDSEAEFSEVLRQFKARDSREQSRQDDADDAEYFVVLVFQSKTQREAFVEHVGEDGPDHQYVDGIRVAEKLDIPIPEVDRNWAPARVDSIFRDYAI